MNRRRFLQTTAGAAALAKLFVQRAYGQAVIQTPLPGHKIPQFVDPLPLLSVAGGPIETRYRGRNRIEHGGVSGERDAAYLRTGEPFRTLGHRSGGTETRLRPRRSWRDTYIGPVIVATRGCRPRSGSSTILGHSGEFPDRLAERHRPDIALGGPAGQRNRAA